MQTEPNFLSVIPSNPISLSEKNYAWGNILHHYHGLFLKRILFLTPTNVCVCSVAQPYPTLCNLTDCQTPLSMGFPRQEYWRGSCHFLLQGIFQTKGSNPHFLCLLHGQVDSLPRSHQGSPKVTYKFC